MVVLVIDIQAIKTWAENRMLTADDSPLELGYRWYHGVRTAKLAGYLAEQTQLEVEQDVLEIGALLHDVGKAGYRGPEPHGTRGARMIRDEAAHLFSTGKLKRVTDIVANHYERPNSKYWQGKEPPSFAPEVLLVQDADVIDHIGANGVWLAFHYGAQELRSQEAAMERFYKVDPTWHQEMIQSLNFPASIQEMKHRLAFSHQFYSQWRCEELGKLTFLA